MSRPLDNVAGHMAPRRRFMTILVVLYVLSLPIISAASYLILRHYSVQSAYERGQLYLTIIESVRHYVEKELRPTLYKELPGRFVLEGMSRSYVSGRVAREVNNSYEGFRYKTAQLINPRNPDNLADPFEAGIIQRLSKNPDAPEWRGNTKTSAGDFCVIARRGKPYSAPCLKCHGAPANAPDELVRRYGPEAGFNMPKDSVVSAAFVYIPISTHLAVAKQEVLAFIGLYTVFFGIMFIYINRRSSDLYDRIETHSRNAERVSADLAELTSTMESMVAERTLGMLSLTVADKIRNPTSIIGGTCRHVLEHDRENMPESLRNSLELIVEEAAELEKIVKDFETLVRSRKSHFVYEDINVVINKLMPMLEGEARKLGIELTFDHSEGPVYLNLEQNLFRNAMHHLVMNAIEATPEGGSVTVSTSVKDNHAEIVVKDTGHGLETVGNEKIFEPFQSTKELSYGLGLPLVKQIVSEHMGEIEAHTPPEGGAEFIIRLPLRWERAL